MIKKNITASHLDKFLGSLCSCRIVGHERNRIILPINIIIIIIIIIMEGEIRLEECPTANKYTTIARAHAHAPNTRPQTNLVLRSFYATASINTHTHTRARARV